MQYIEPHFNDMQEYYGEEYRKTHNDSLPDDSVETRYQFQAFKAKGIAEAVKELVPVGGSILDIGCSAGGLLAHLEHDYEVYGAEWNAEDRAFVLSSGVPCEDGDIKDIFPGKKFTAITAIDVIEHQPDPVEFLRDIRSRLIGGGYLYMETPNVDDALLSQYDIPEFSEYWYRQPHITYWNAGTLAQLLTWLGFEARLDWRQRYGLASHMRWLDQGKPMVDPYAARNLMKPVSTDKGTAPALNRIWAKLDHEYRIQLRTLYACDTITVRARMREI